MTALTVAGCETVYQLYKIKKAQADKIAVNKNRVYMFGGVLLCLM